ncbi:DUF6531 domain-containing protein [Streptomyces sp. NPDC001288]|uniref:DUF6531 domain-containing protein n=1 Tax=Streptomyces sp. NPDC001297 TaxID=3364559 RepID=UPI0036A9B749
MVDLNPLHYVSKFNHMFGDSVASGLEFLGISDPAVDPDGVREIAKKWRSLATGLDGAATAAERSLRGVEWEGRTAKEFGKRNKAARKQATEMAHALREGAKALDDFADKAHELLSEIGVMLAEIAEFEIAGLALSVLTAGASDVAATLMAGERALKVVALVGRIEEEGTALGSAVRGVMEVIRGVERALKALKEIRGVAAVARMAKEGATFTAFTTLLEDPGAFKDPEKLAGILAEGAAMGVGFGVLGKALGKGLKALKPSELAKLTRLFESGGGLSRLRLRPGELEELEAGVAAAEKECKLDPIDVATGTMILPQTDVELPASLPLILERTHLSSYRFGGWFGPSWSSTLDQRLQADDGGFVFAAPDGARLVYPPLPPDATEPVLPSNGPRLPLSWDRETDGALRITHPDTGLSYVFHTPRPTDDREALDLPIQVIENRHGQRITVEYADDGTPAGVAHSGGYRLALDRHPRLPRIVGLRLLDADDERSRGTLLETFGYDENGLLTEVGDSSGRPLRFTYDDEGRITSWTDRNGNSYQYTYDGRGRVARTTGTGGYLTGTLEYDDATRTTVVTDSLGHSTRYEHNEALRLVRQTDALGNAARWTWDTEGRLTAFTDPLGNTTRHGYDERGLLVSVRRPDGVETHATYDERGLPTSITGPDGGVWRQEYDEQGNRTAVTDPMGVATRFSYTPLGLVATVTDGLGRTTEFRYNRAGLPLAVTDALGGVTRYAYDHLGRQTAVTDPAGNSTRLEWNLEGLPVRATGPDGSNESWSYDAEGNCTSHTDALGGVTRFAYGAFDVLASRTDPDGAHYTFAHDPALRLTGVTNPQGATWKYTYDPAGRLTAETDFDDRTLGYAYDAAGRFRSFTTPLGSTITYELDPAGRTVAKDADGDRTTYTYDVAGNLVAAATASSSLALELDPVGRVLAETVDGHTTRYTYDSVGRRTGRTTPTGAVTVLSHDAGTLPTAVRLAGHVLHVTRDAQDRETARTFGPADAPVTLTQSWDALGRRTGQRLAAGHRTLRSRAYGYRPDGGLVSVTDLVAGESRRVTLDPVGRPLTVTAGDWSESYAYDAAGNQTFARWPDQAPHPEARGARTYDGSRIRDAGAVRHEYDTGGRMVLRQRRRLSRKPDTWRYEWDAEDRLVACTTPDGTLWTYDYDPLGRRTAKHRMGPDRLTRVESVRFTWDATRLAEQIDGATGAVTTWEYEDDRPLAQLERRDSTLPSPAPPGTPEPSDAQDSVDSRFFAIVTDLVGTPTELVSEDGRIAWHGRATIWGTTAWSRRSTAYTPLRLPGQYADHETGLHYNFFRHYDPDTARYATPDPLGLAPAPNPVAYVGNPETLSDPLGLVPKACKQDRYKWDGSVRFGKLDDLDRPTGIYAALRKEMLNTGSEAGTTRTPGWRGDGTAFNEARGHLLANILGGPGKGPYARQNLVTLTQNPVNTPVMKAIEAKVYKAVDKGEIVQYSVKPVYEGTNPIPIRLEISAHGNRGFSLHEPLENPAAGVRTAVP